MTTPTRSHYKWSIAFKTDRNDYENSYTREEEFDVVAETSVAALAIALTKLGLDPEEELLDITITAKKSASTWSLGVGVEQLNAMADRVAGSC